jgi:hypothetical protein
MPEPPEVVHHCRQLLLDHEKAWIEFQRQQQGATGRNDLSQWITVDGRPYDCATNRPCGNCLWDGSKGHQKCKCRQMYVPGQGHLVAPCNAKGQGPQLSYDQCKKLGYLDDPAPGTARPVYPTITTDHCREAFEALQANFTPDNYEQVVQCINRLENPQGGKAASSSSRAIPWIAAGLIVLILLTAFIAYKVIRGCLKHREDCKPHDHSSAASPGAFSPRGFFSGAAESPPTAPS